MIQAQTYGTLVYCAERRLETRHGEFALHRFKNFATRNLALAVSLGELRSPEPVLARVHSSCLTSEAFGACDCDCAEQLEIAFAEIARAGRGVIFYLMQEGRGAGFVAKARDRMTVQASGNQMTTFEAYQQMGIGSDRRRYGEVAAMCRLLGIEAPLRLLTNNPEKAAALAEEGLQVEGLRSLDHEPSPFNLHYLTAKLHSGHSLAAGDGAQRAAELPESVAAFAPYALDGAAGLIHMASYLLPIRFAENGAQATPSWFRLHAYFDVGAGREHVILTHERRKDLTPLAGVQRESLEDRLPLRRPSDRHRQWRAAVERIVGWGAGAVLFVTADDVGGDVSVDETGLGLLARHLPGRRARCLDPSDEWLRERLRDHGVAVEERSA